MSPGDIIGAIFALGFSTFFLAAMLLGVVELFGKDIRYFQMSCEEGSELGAETDLPASYMVHTLRMDHLLPSW